MKRSLSPFWFVLLLLAAALGVLAAEDDFLEPEKAFKVGVRALDAKSVEVSFDIAPGYYMYREQFRFSAAEAQLGAPDIPRGKVKYDQTFEKDVETHRDVVRVRVPVEQAGASFRLDIVSQGCADKGLCYPPMQSAADVSLAGFGGSGSARVVAVSDTAAAPAAATAPAATPPPAAAPQSGTAPAVNVASSVDGAKVDAALRSGRFWAVVGVFFAAGVLLSFTPCVLPMLPILSSIIVGQGAVSRSRGLALAACYSLGMALVYTAFGIAAGLAGEGMAAALQNPWVLGTFAALLVALALSMFGAYELQLPSAITGRLAETSQRLPAGRAAGVFVMGGVSALIVSPCVAAPLAGALVYLSQTGDVVLGGTALFSLAAGMSVPLLLVGASAGSFLPRAGAWMDGVKRFFGLLLLGVAVWTVQPVVPAGLVLALWGALAIGAALLLWPTASSSGSPAWARRTGGAVLAVLGLMQIAGAASGGSDPLQPLAHLARGGAPQK